VTSTDREDRGTGPGAGAHHGDVAIDKNLVEFKVTVHQSVVRRSKEHVKQKIGVRALWYLTAGDSTDHDLSVLRSHYFEEVLAPRKTHFGLELQFGNEAGE
jgi:hypothetical protein